MDFLKTDIICKCRPTEGGQRQLTVREVVGAACVPGGAALTSADLLCELGCV